MLPPRLQITGITKAYPGVLANSNVNLTVLPGEIHAVLGENGAGKSTLMKIIFGSIQPDTGHMVWNGQPLHLANPHDARACGINMVFQHFNLFETLSVAQNVWLGLDRSQSLAQVTARIQAKAAEYGLDMDPHRPVHTLSVGEMQRVEIIRALMTEPQLLILDEPTSVLTPQAVDKLFVVLRTLAAQGCSILYISHKLHEIRSLCHTCTVLRGGKVAGVCIPANETNASLSRLMIGSEPPQLTHNAREAGDAVLQVKALSLAPQDQFGVALDAVALQVRAGEVVGIAGVSGNGQKELFCALSGEDRRANTGSIWMGQTDVSRCGPGARRALGQHCVPEERLGRGAVPSMSLAHNVLLTRSSSLSMRRFAGGWIRVQALEDHAARLIARFQVKASGPRALAKSLSGGNLQKFMVGREIDAAPKLLIVSQPTWGVDVGAAAQIRADLLALRDAGCAVLVVSDELEELFELCDRMHVMARGRLSPSIATPEASVERIGDWMSGLW